MKVDFRLNFCKRSKKMTDNRQKAMEMLKRTVVALLEEGGTVPSFSSTGTGRRKAPTLCLPLFYAYSDVPIVRDVSTVRLRRRAVLSG